MLLWLKMEEYRKIEKIGTLDAHDVRNGVFYVFKKNLWFSFFSQLFFYYVAFFGTGNVASISSFEISSCYRFTTVFAPFLMATLLITKILVPLFLVICTYRVINRKLKIPETGAFFIVIALSEVMTMNFFFLVKVNS